ncbi:MAG: hypothetical protein HWD59_09975 [Coxiellaceae bacterium]|nr:MAG: hypothetical protein HWD59_09975 [Coxiellaceae bacterium]
MKTYKAQCIKNEVSDFTLYQKLIQFTLNFRGDLSSILELQTTPTLFKDIDQACAQYVDFAHKILEKNNHYQIVMEEILQRIIADLNPPSNNNNTALANGTTHSISISQ